MSVSCLLSSVVVVTPSVEYQSWTEEREAVLPAEGIAPQQQTGRTSVLHLCVLEPLLTRWLPLHFVLTVSSICLTLHLWPFPFFLLNFLFHLTLLQLQVHLLVIIMIIKFLALLDFQSFSVFNLKA